MNGVDDEVIEEAEDRLKSDSESDTTDPEDKNACECDHLLDQDADTGLDQIPRTTERNPGTTRYSLHKRITLPIRYT